MKRIVWLTLCMILFVFALTDPARAATYDYEGTISTENGGLYVSDIAWGGASLQYGVTQNGSLWTYSYIFTVPDLSKEISHVIIELSDGSKGANIDSFTPESDKLELGFYSSSNGNPGMPDTGMYGLKWDLTEGAYVYSFSVTTDMSPMWGDFYAKDGRNNKVSGEENSEVYAFNTGFGSNLYLHNAWDSGPIYGANGYGRILVPNTAEGNPVPIPSTMLLLGSGLFGLITLRKRFSPPAA